MIEYLAGYFDADGSVGLYRYRAKRSKQGYYHGVRVRVDGTVRRPIELFAERFGGSPSIVHRPARQHSQSMLSWTLAGQRTGVFLQAVLPYLTVKRRQVRLALRYLRECGKVQPGLNHRWNPISDEVFARRDKYMRWMFQLKRGDISLLS